MTSLVRNRLGSCMSAARCQVEPHARVSPLPVAVHRTEKRMRLLMTRTEKLQASFVRGGTAEFAGAPLLLPLLPLQVGTAQQHMQTRRHRPQSWPGWTLSCEAHLQAGSPQDCG